jgi:hypothetical protein
VAWEWLPAVSGAVVGVAGIVAGLLTARGQRRLQLDLLREDHKHQEILEYRNDLRRLFARYRAEVHDASHALQVSWDAEDQPVRRPNHETIRTTLKRVFGIYLEIDLVASPEVTRLAMDVYTELLRKSLAVHGQVSGGNGPISRQVVDAAGQKLASVLIDLSNAMRAELGKAPLPDAVGKRPASREPRIADPAAQFPVSSASGDVAADASDRGGP